MIFERPGSQAEQNQQQRNELLPFYIHTNPENPPRSTQSKSLHQSVGSTHRSTAILSGRTNTCCLADLSSYAFLCAARPNPEMSAAGSRPNSTVSDVQTSTTFYLDCGDANTLNRCKAAPYHYRCPYHAYQLQKDQSDPTCEDRYDCEPN